MAPCATPDHENKRLSHRVGLRPAAIFIAFGECNAIMTTGYVTSKLRIPRLRSLLEWAFGPRNFMKNRHRGIMTKAGVGEVGGTVEKLRLLACLIRSMRALRE